MWSTMRIRDQRLTHYALLRAVAAEQERRSAAHLAHRCARHSAASSITMITRLANAPSVCGHNLIDLLPAMVHRQTCCGGRQATLGSCAADRPNLSVDHGAPQRKAFTCSSHCFVPFAGGPGCSSELAVFKGAQPGLQALLQPPHLWRSRSSAVLACRVVLLHTCPGHRSCSHFTQKSMCQWLW